MTNTTDMRREHRSYALKATSIEINGEPYELNDVSAEGIGLILEENSAELFMGQRIESIPIPHENGTAHIQGVVAHISKTAQNTVCGVRFLFKNPEEFKLVEVFKAQRTLDTA